MFRRQIQNSMDIAALGVPWANAVRAVRERNISIDADINDDFGLSRKTMNVTRLMILRIGNEQDTAETKRCHAPLDNPSNLGYQAGSRIKFAAAN
jgi:hypothetical protein